MKKNTIPEDNLTNSIPEYPVRFWEIILIIMGAFGLLGSAVIGLGSKVIKNMFTPARAEAIAQSLFDYQIPGSAQGVVGVNFGAKKIAIISSQNNPPDITLFVSKAPIEQIKEEDSLNLDITLQEVYQGSFIVTSTKIENQELCGKSVPVSIQVGKHLLGEPSQPIDGIRYMAKITDNGVERKVNIITNGENAQEKAAKVFHSLECRFES
ncbi:hypothetical protein [Calothrix sp. UHCC 0171]|uniref:hypothetical protein n=1 Tax=Calothrix sp. UHCC 0171 TaxID=3110245 RepID=UPI002B20DA83|nr:hypothetical protein [Calothrix sp. UHCC 0171]MEA5572009.1 hypothetical protein [Calothrix sp. UHCC 0171]